MRFSILISGLLLLLAANLVMMYAVPFGLSKVEGFYDASGTKMDASGNKLGFRDGSGFQTGPAHEGFTSYSLANGGGAGDQYAPMGAFDGVRLSTGNNSSWRYTAPNEPLQGPAFKPGDDALFMFKNNQCKPECCGASFSCGGGCVCTTPEQRDYINKRGGNRTAPEDGV